MIAAMAAAASTVSTLRLVSGPVDLSDKLALVEEPGPLDEAEPGTGAGACAAGPIKATGCANADGDVDSGDRRIAHRRALAAYRIGPKRHQPQEKEYRPTPHGFIYPQRRTARKES
jgi:hypothetical protein